MRGIGPKRGQGRPVMAGDRHADPRNRVRVRACDLLHRDAGAAMCLRSGDEGHASEQRNPTAVQSGNRHAALLGERRRERSAGNRLSRAEPQGSDLRLNGPRRAQAGSHLPVASARYQRLLVRKSCKQAHAVTSRVTSWAFWFFSFVPEVALMLALRPTAIDIVRLCERLSESNRRPTTDVEAAVWLRSSGFVPYGEGWIADDDAIGELDVLLGDSRRAHRSTLG